MQQYTEYIVILICFFLSKTSRNPLQYFLNILLIKVFSPSYYQNSTQKSEMLSIH